MQEKQALAQDLTWLWLLVNLGRKSVSSFCYMTQSYGKFWLLADIRKMLSVHIPDARKALLLTEIDRVRQV